MDTKTCSLTENEIKQLIIWHGYNLNDEGKIDATEDMEDRISRIAYLNKRLKAAFKEDTSKSEEQPKTETQPETKATASW